MKIFLVCILSYAGYSFGQHWQVNGNYEYYFASQSAEISYDDARAACTSQDNDATLAIIKSQAQNNFIVGLAPGNGG